MAKSCRGRSAEGCLTVVLWNHVVDKVGYTIVAPMATLSLCCKGALPSPDSQLSASRRSKAIRENTTQFQSDKTEYQLPAIIDDVAVGRRRPV